MLRTQGPRKLYLILLKENDLPFLQVADKVDFPCLEYGHIRMQVIAGVMLLDCQAYATAASAVPEFANLGEQC